MVVTKIEEYTQGKSKIYLNDSFAFVLYKGELRQLKLKEGEELIDATYERIMNDILDKRAKMRAMHLLEKQDRTEKGLRQKLKENLYPEEIIDSAVEYVKHYHYIDDGRYAENFIAYRKSTMSRNEMKNKLMQKGISADIIESKIEEAYRDDEGAEYELIKSLMLKKYGNIAAMSHDERNKMLAFFYRKGFPVRLVEEVIRDCS